MKEQSIRQQRRHQDTADHRKAVVFLRESKQSPYAKNIVPYFPVNFRTISDFYTWNTAFLIKYVGMYGH